MNQKVLDRIKKLLSLSESPNEHEAATAAAMATALMQEHNIHQAMLNEGVDEALVQEWAEHSRRVSSWKLRLLTSLGKANGVLAPKVVGQGILLVGQETDVRVVSYLYAYCVKAVDRLTTQSGRGMGKAWCNDYRHGCVDTIVKKIAEIQKETEEKEKKKALSSGVSLLVINKALAQREEKLAKARCEVKTESVSISLGHKNYARYQGQQDGKSINIRKTEARLGQ